MGREAIRAAVLVLLLAATAAAQSDATSSSPASADPFATIHKDLTESAENVLADTVQQMAKAAATDPSSHFRASPEALIREFEQHYRPDQPNLLRSAAKRLEELRSSVDSILQSEGVPREMASVILVESGGRTNAISPKGALGLWQLMPDTAIRYGLRVGPGSDDRLDVAKSTRAAARYLSDLYQQFGSWPLALAAYNFGEERLRRAIARGGTRDFVELSRERLLPQETRSYVPAVLSAMQLSGSGRMPSPPNSYSKTASVIRLFAEPRVQP